MNHRIYELEPPLKGKERGAKKKRAPEKDARINANKNFSNYFAIVSE
jgi:hypothetical protein